MPLRNHFRPPVDELAPWEAIHGQWPAVLVQHLTRILPARYVAMPRIHAGSQVEIDVPTYEKEQSTGVGPEHANGGVAMAVWAPAVPDVSAETDFADIAEYEVKIYDQRAGAQKLVAAIEIVSPSNKDRPEHRRTFVAKCVALLKQRVSVAIVDLVTMCDFNLYKEMLDAVNVVDSSIGTDPSAIYVAECRTRVDEKERRRLETWSHALEIGKPLPTLPIWLTESLAVPLDLESSYEQTCRDLRIP